MQKRWLALPIFLIFIMTLLSGCFATQLDAWLDDMQGVEHTTPPLSPLPNQASLSDATPLPEVTALPSAATTTPIAPTPMLKPTPPDSPQASVTPIPPTPQTDEPFNLEDFDYISGYRINPDEAGREAYQFPDGPMIIGAFGEPIDATEGDDSLNIEYDFGSIICIRSMASGEIIMFNLNIENDKLAGPRGTRVGDDAQTVLDRFRNDIGNVTSDGELYNIDDDPFCWGTVSYNKAGELFFITYAVGNATKSACRVIYDIEGGKVAAITWYIDQ